MHYGVRHCQHTGKWQTKCEQFQLFVSKKAAIFTSSFCDILQSRQWPEVYDLCHFFACCASQKTHGHARIARETHAILAYPCVFWLKQHARTCGKIWYLRPLPIAEQCFDNFWVTLSKTWPVFHFFKQNLPVWGNSLRNITTLGSNLASVTDLKRIQTPHNLCCGFGGDKPLKFFQAAEGHLLSF